MTSNRSTKPSARWTPLSSIHFLVSCSLGLVATGCASSPVATSFDGKWEFILRKDQPVKACLVEEDVAKLRELLIRCKADSQ